MSSDFLNGLDGLSDLLSGSARAKEMQATLDRVTSRLRDLEERTARLRALALDPGQSHRMITRKEILRILDGKYDDA